MASHRYRRSFRPARMALATGLLGCLLTGLALNPLPAAAPLLGPSRADADALGSGTVTQGGQLVVTGLGDSVPAAAMCGCSGFVPLVADAVGRRAGRRPVVHNLGRGGLTSSGLLAQLSGSTARTALARSDLVLVTIGANDLSESTVTRPSCVAGGVTGCSTAALAALSRNLDAALVAIGAAGRPGRTTVLVTGYWNVFKDGRVGRARGPEYVRGSLVLTRAANAVIQARAVAHGARYVDLVDPFNGNGTRDDTGLLAADGDHPDRAGHQLIADLLLAAWSANGS